MVSLGIDTLKLIRDHPNGGVPPGGFGEGFHEGIVLLVAMKNLENILVDPASRDVSLIDFATARQGHVLQLAAYCLLVEETEGVRPAYGIIKYADQAFRVDNTRELRRTLLATLDAMRRDLARDQSRRSHSDPARCRRCGVRAACDERLA